MNSITLICPKCKEQITIDEALGHRIENDIKSRLRDEFNQKWLEEKKKLYQEVLKKANQKAEEEIGQERKRLQEELDRKDKLLKKSQEYELKLRQDRNLLEENIKNFELDKQRLLDAERKKIEETITSRLFEEHRLREADKEKIISDLKKSLEDAQRKAYQGSQQLQGEVMELELEDSLKHEFLFDEIKPVSKGIRGADVLQIVRDLRGRDCGVMIWESKRTKNWDDKWISKLKDDMRSSKADIAILVSMVLPQGVKNFSFKNGIYITNFECFLNIAGILRMNIVKLFNEKQLKVNNNERIENLYKFITSSEFSQHIDSMMETYNSMKLTLDRERSTMMRLWAQRDKEIERLKNNTLTIHGSLSGLTGEALPELKSLEILTTEDSGSIDVVVGPNTSKLDDDALS